MSFYKSISAEYDNIFPINTDQVHFVMSHIGAPGQVRLLDVGCGTGSLILALSEKKYTCTGIDYNREMVKIASKKAANFRKPADMLYLDMLDLESGLKDKFSAITCLGNTLVHLQNRDQVFSFLNQSRNKLSEPGKLILQIINYDRIYQQNIKQLPLIENDNILFKREYKLHPQRVDFISKLTIKKTGKIIRNKVSLLPLFYKDIRYHLSSSGFDKQQYYGNFKSDSYDIDSYALIVVAEKKRISPRRESLSPPENL